MELLLLRKKSKTIKRMYFCSLLEKRSTYGNRPFDFSSLSNEDSRNLFRFEKADILELVRLLRIPVQIICKNGSTVSNVEGLCIFLRRMVYPNRFGLNGTWLNPNSLNEFCNAVQAKGSPLRNCWGFVDGTVRPICRPKVYQRQVYNGRKRVHALKYQSVVAANGLIADFYGPIEGRRHDAYLLSESKLVAALERTVGLNGETLCIYGDPAYPLRPQLMSPYKGSRLSDQQKTFNKAMSKCRIVVEWSFGKMISLFAFVDFKKNQKLYMQPLAKYMKVCAILTNCHTCLYGSTTSSFFGVDPPTIEEYLSD